MMSLLLAQHGLAIGIAMLVLVAICAVGLGRKAAQGVRQFRQDQHERFVHKTGR